MEVPDELLRLAEQQYGLASTEQASRYLTRGALRRLRALGVLSPFGRNVLRFTGAPRSWRQQAMGATLAYGAPVALSHLAAARLLGWEGVGLPPIEVAVPLNRSGRREGVQTHRVHLPGPDVVLRHGIPTTSPARTVVDLAGRLAERHLEGLFDHLIRCEHLRASDVLDRVPSAATDPGHRLCTLHRVTELRLDHQPASGSVWEDRVAGWLRDAGLPDPVRQHQVVIGDRVHLLDLAYPDEKVAVEFDGWEWHRSRRSFDLDRSRTTELTLAGWLVVLVTSAHGEAATADRVARALRSRGWRGPG